MPFLVLVNLFALLISFSASREFAKEKAKQQKSGEFHKVREKHMIEDAVKGYLDWINQAGTK